MDSPAPGQRELRAVGRTMLDAGREYHEVVTHVRTSGAPPDVVEAVLKELWADMERQAALTIRANRRATGRKQIIGGLALMLAGLTLSVVVSALIAPSGFAIGFSGIAAVGLGILATGVRNVRS